MINIQQKPTEEKPTLEELLEAYFSDNKDIMDYAGGVIYSCKDNPFSGREYQIQDFKTGSTITSSEPPDFNSLKNDLTIL